ncbi:MAG TPA: cell division protein FtsL [Acidiferrobacterales bacterium]|nr:cell division protein FtsL [Acidiferrobacterales bacterium]
MDKKFILLIMAVVLASAAVIELRHRNRLYSAELQNLQTQRDAIDTEWGQLLLEQGAWSQHRRVEELAGTQLGMVLPKPEQIILVPASQPKATP